MKIHQIQKNTKVVNVVNDLRSFDIEPLIVDPVADSQVASLNNGVKLASLYDIKGANCLVFADSHEAFRNFNGMRLIHLFVFDNNNKINIDINSLLNRAEP